MEQLLDLYLPDNDTIQWNKVILMLHGGSWVSGKKEHINGQVRRFRDLLPDYVIANMDYRLGEGCFVHNFLFACMNTSHLKKYLGN